MSTHPTLNRLQQDRVIEPRVLIATTGEEITVPAQGKLVHLQFRRFAGCPVCNLHLHSIARRHDEIAAAGILELAVFHSSAEALRPFTDGLPFAVIPDPGKQLYAEFGVESGRRSLLDPRGWPMLGRAIVRSMRAIRAGREPIPTWDPPGGRFGLPADFLIAGDGRIRDLKYGSHVYDQWSVDELLALVQSDRTDSRRWDQRLQRHDQPR